MTRDELQLFLEPLSDNELEVTARMALRTLQQRRRLRRRQAKVIELFPGRGRGEGLEDMVTICPAGPMDD